MLCIFYNNCIQQIVYNVYKCIIDNNLKKTPTLTHHHQPKPIVWCAYKWDSLGLSALIKHLLYARLLKSTSEEPLDQLITQIYETERLKKSKAFAQH